MIPWCLGLPTIDGKTARGASSPAKPALHIPEPLSITNAATSSRGELVLNRVKCKRVVPRPFLHGKARARQKGGATTPTNTRTPRKLDDIGHIRSGNRHGRNCSRQEAQAAVARKLARLSYPACSENRKSRASASNHLRGPTHNVASKSQRDTVANRDQWQAIAHCRARGGVTGPKRRLIRGAGG